MSADPGSTSIPTNKDLSSFLPGSTARSFASHFGFELIRSVRAHSLLAALIFAYWAIGIVILRRYPVHAVDYVDVIRDDFEMLAIFFPGMVLVAYATYVTLVVRPDRLTRHICQGIVTRGFTLHRLCTIFPVALLLPLAITSYSGLKAAIPLINPYSWDPALARFGKVLHGGQQAWQLLQPSLGHHWATFFLNVVYNLWYFVVFIVLFWQTTNTSRPQLRMQYLVTWVLQWALLGNLVATLLSSVGPAFYSRLSGGADPYAPLMQYLRSVDLDRALWAVKTQDSLWQCYVDYGPAGGCGISAMPSMHVAMAFSFVLLACKTNRWIGAVSIIYCALILIGSVHLGWHYASDGYVAIVGTWLIWLMVGWLLGQPKIKRWLGVAADCGAVTTGSRYVHSWR